MISLFLTFYLVLTSSVSGDSPIACATDNVSCDIHEDNLLENIYGVATVEECRQLCYDNDDCQFITYYSPDSFPLQETCILFKTCEETHSCSDCVTETRSCYEVCSSNIVGAIDNNTLAFVADVESESKCKDYCGQTPNCTYYTYFLEEDPNAQLCILLSQLIEPLQPCDTCVTGPVDCSNQDCRLEFDGESHRFLMFTQHWVNLSVTIPAPESAPGCQLRILSVGGGGSAESVGGAGSGYLKYHEETVTNDTVIILNVGDSGQASFVIINSQNVITAGAGHDSHADGGDGYSGGGAWGQYDACCDGGHNGGDGQDSSSYHGGHGSGEDLKSFMLDNFVLSPGAGGKFQYGDGYYYGGGGGGVLVNGEGPQQNTDDSDGEGYGGGGGRLYEGGHYSSNGLPGVILVEVAEKKN